MVGIKGRAFQDLATSFVEALFEFAFFVPQKKLFKFSLDINMLHTWYIGLHGPCEPI